MNSYYWYKKTVKSKHIYTICLLFFTFFISCNQIFDFNDVEKATRFDQEKERAAFIKKLSYQCERWNNYSNNLYVKSNAARSIVDTCFEVVNSEKVHVYQNKPITYFFFKHPHAKDAALVSVGFIGGLAFYWLFFV